MEQNIFKEVSALLDARKVVADFLGEPAKISGDNYFWKSPFYEGDNDPSFCATKDMITDFSSSSEFGQGQDICDFIMKYNNLYHNITINNMNNFDALKWVNEHYKLGLNLLNVDFTKKESAVKASNQKTQIIYSLDKVEKLTHVINAGVETYFDKQKYDKKPNSNETGKIKKRIDKRDFGCYSVEQVKKNIIGGMTCIPSGIKSKNDWIDGESVYQMFMIDFDNSNIEMVVDAETEESKKQKVNYTFDTEQHISIERIIDYCREIQLEPTFIYTTFSHTEQQHKFRLVYILNEPVQEKAQIEGVYDSLKEIFKDYHIDNSATDIARLFYGGHEIVYESENYYKVVQEEIEIEDENVEDADTSEIHYSEYEKQCNIYLKYTPYEARNKHLGYISKNGQFVHISNFIPYCLNKITYINGNDIDIKYEMGCILLDADYIQLPSIIIDANAYSRCDFFVGSPWDKHCIISAGNGNSQRLREAMQHISRNTMNEKKIYTHTGFRTIDGNLCYLYHRRSYR